MATPATSAPQASAPQASAPQASATRASATRASATRASATRASATPTSVLAAVDPCAPSSNPVVCENSKSGTDPAVWDDFWGAGSDTIQGFATDISVDVGQKIDFKVDTDASSYDIDIYRIGYYDGDGARLITSIEPSAPLPQQQPQCVSDVQTALYDCGNWMVSASWTVPTAAVSGVYIAHLKRRDTGASSHITFVVRDDSNTSDLVFQTSDPTWQAYNDYGGADFYTGGENGRAYKISYNRPVITRGGPGGRDFFFANEYPTIRFLERNGYDVSYIAGVDTDRHGALLRNHKTFLSVGHDEYWSGAQRANVEAARDAGVNLMFLSGNEIYWRTRYEKDLNGTGYRTLVSYKETWDNAKIDPSAEWTGTWRDPRFAAASAGAGRPENELTGTAYMSNASDLPVTVSAEEGKLRLWRNTGLGSLAPGTTAALAPHTVGYESNEDLDNGHRPAGLVRLSTTTGPTSQYLRDYGNTVTPGTTTHHVTMYRAPSGALVFSAGSIQWAWGLDSEHDSPYAAEPADPRMQQAQVNLLADMGAQPGTLDPALTPATASTDTTGPTVAITSPAAGANVANGATVTVAGTASDTGGRVAGVEVSGDGGATWHPANGTSSWSYSYLQRGQGNVAIMVRATDDSANIGATASRDVSVACPCSVFGDEVPETPAADDSGAVELGMRFSATRDGYISGVRFYKGTGNGGTHVGSLWSASGALLARVTFEAETATGWQKATFPTGVAVSAGETYVVSYTAPQGRYAVQKNAFYDAPRVSEPLRVAGGYGAQPAGVYGATGQFPASVYQSSNYYVDPVFVLVDDSPLQLSGQWPLPGSSSVPIGTTVQATYSKPIVAGSAGITVTDANGQRVTGSTTYDATSRTLTFTPSAPLPGFVKYQVAVVGTDQVGHSVTGGTWSFTTAKPAGAAGVCPCTLFDDDAVPAVLEANDTDAVTLGVRFASSANGTITGVRFYKGAGNTGAHTGALWAMDGTQLAVGTFSGESTAGWQTLTFATPVPIARDTEYIASYRTTVGRYSVTPSGFQTNLSRDPLRVAPDSGAYTYGTGFPSARSSSNYMVDVVFERSPDPLTIVRQDPAPGATGVARGATIEVEFSTAVTGAASMSVRSGGTVIAGSTTQSGGGTVLTFVPADALPADADITVGLSGVSSAGGATLPDQSWMFHTRSNEDPETLFTGQLPATAAANDGAPVELGTVIVPAVDGRITGVRFYKGAGNDGIHTGSLWSASGQRLATVTFQGESATGWQTALFSTPVDVTAGTTYIASYYAPQGHYAFTSGFFAQPLVSGNLTAPASNNGRYLYAAGGGFPAYSYNSASYFVDALFVSGATPPAPTPTISLASTTPASGAVDVPTSTTPSARFSTPIRTTGWAMTLSQGTSAVAGAAALSTDGTTLTFTPSAALASGATYTVTLTGVTSTDGATLGTSTWTFTTTPPTTHTMFGSTTPATTSLSTLATEVATLFRPSVDGRVTAIRFYKATANTGTHTGSIWTTGGQRLGTVTFTGETASGWQTATLSTPVAVTAGSTYLVSYYAPRGRYSTTSGFFNTAFTAGPLTAPAHTIASPNGRYRLFSSGLPNLSGSGTNYFVDVVLTVP
ncbi:DUF4082 domain-containing protein [Nocardioides sp. GY 10113]|uniref:DUF4082 domain-containing protein n=1 Tax=Nocardioides sp. GY 10113 TaxID=2569761 RepID=UPI001F0E6731|nr:DUF4082 domain-containing protein [Nocardioides sp. GY 10113]